MRRLVLGFVVALAFASAAGAEAQTLRIPKTGEPALALAMPTNWTAKYDDLGNLQYSSVDRSLNIQLSVIDDPAVTMATLAEVAASIFKEGGIPAYTRSAPGSIDGRKGETFFAKKTYGNDGTVVFEVTLVKIDSGHIASMGRVTLDGLTAAQLAPLDGVVRQVRIIDAR
jgi:hypothetical protein